MQTDTYPQTDREIDRLIDKYTYRPRRTDTNKQTVRHTDWQAYRQTDILTNI